MRSSTLLFGAAALFTPIFAQTWTSCNPTNATGPTCPDDLALGMNHTFVFNSSTAVTDAFNITAGSLGYDATNGASFTVAKKGDSPTIQSQFYIFWGSVSVVMKAASGQGIISSVVLESDDLDEVDWEFMGGNSTHAETNYFGKGNTTSFDRAIYYPMADPRADFHNYTVHWTSDQLQWYIDSNLVRTLPYAAANNGNNYPQTPMTVRIGIWAGGDADNANGTIEWAGGLTDYSQGPYTMYVKSAEINDFSVGKAYSYSDHTGSWQSIKTISGNSTVAQTIVKAETPTLTTAQKFAALPSSTKLAIYCGSAGAGALLLGAMLFTCIRQRRAGAKERDAYNAQIEKQQADAYKDQMELREKGLGGWDKKEVATLGDDALGGWGGTHVPAGTRVDDLDAIRPATAASASGPFADKHAINNNSVEQFPFPSSASAASRTASPALPRVNSPPIARYQTPSLVSPQPQSPARAFSGNNGGLINNAGNAYNGGFNSPRAMNSRTPSFPLQGPGAGSSSPRANNFSAGGGYSRF